MLWLTRREGERIRIGEDITIVIHPKSKYTTLVGIEAPRDVRVVREELLDEPNVAETAGGVT